MAPMRYPGKAGLAFSSAPKVREGRIQYVQNLHILTVK